MAVPGYCDGLSDADYKRVEASVLMASATYKNAVERAIEDNERV